MEKKIRAILIDAENHTITETEVEAHKIEDISRLLRIGDSPFDCVQWEQGNTSETVYVDDEGLLKEPKHFFCCPGYPQWLAGNGLILGTGSHGESKPSQLTLEEVQRKVVFGTLA